MSKTRVEAFTDAVIAIVMTLMVLELKIPVTDSWNGLLSQSHKLIIYLISFINLAIYWNNHHHMFQLAKTVNGSVLWLNNWFIFSISLFPFATSWLSEFPLSQAPELTYGLIVFLANLAYLFLAKGLIKTNGTDSLIAQRLKDNWKPKISVSLNLVALLLGYLIAPIIVLIVNIVILIMWVVPEKTVEQHYQHL